MNFKKILWEEYILFFMFLIISMISIYFSDYFLERIYLEKLSQDYYSSNTIYFYIKDIKNKMNTKNIYDKLNNVILFKELSINNDFRGILFKGNIEKPKMLQGRFFNENDFFNNKTLAIIGKNYINNLEKKGDKYYLSVSGKLFEVIGIIGANIESKLDNILLVNLDAINEIKSGVYALDGENKSYLKLSFNDLRNYFRNNMITYNKIIREEVGIKRLLNYEKNNIFIFFIIFITFILSSISVSISWYEKKKVQIYVQKLVGYNNLIIISEIIKRYLILTNLAYIIGLIISVILSYVNIINLHFMGINFYSYLIVVFFGVLVIIVPIITYMKNFKIKDFYV